MRPGRAIGNCSRCAGGSIDLRLSPADGMRYDRKRGETLTITISAALIEDAPRYEDCRSTDSDNAFTSSDSTGIDSRFLRSSSHSVFWLGICSRFARLVLGD